MKLVKLKVYKIEDKKENEKRKLEGTLLDFKAVTTEEGDNEHDSFWGKILNKILKKKASSTSKSGCQERRFDISDDGAYYKDLLDDAMLTSDKQDDAIEIIVEDYCKGLQSHECWLMVATFVDDSNFSHIVVTDLKYSEAIMEVGDDLSGSSEVVNGDYHSFLSYPLYCLDRGAVSNACKVVDKDNNIQKVFCLTPFVDPDEMAQEALKQALEKFDEKSDHVSAFTKKDSSTMKRTLFDQDCQEDESSFPIYDGSMRLDSLDCLTVVRLQEDALAEFDYKIPFISLKDRDGSVIKLDPRKIGIDFNLVQDDCHGNYAIVKLNGEESKGALNIGDFYQHLDPEDALKWMKSGDL